MSDFEVPEAIICSPFEEPTHYWRLEEGAEPEKRPGRRPAIYYYPDPVSQDVAGTVVPTGTAIELKLVSLIRSRVKEWRAVGYPGVTATTFELLNYWRRDGRGFRFFFAQLEAAETISSSMKRGVISRRGSTFRWTSPAINRRPSVGTRPSADTPARWPRVLARPPSWG